MCIILLWSDASAHIPSKGGTCFSLDISLDVWPASVWWVQQKLGFCRLITTKKMDKVMLAPFPAFCIVSERYSISSFYSYLFFSSPISPISNSQSLIFWQFLKEKGRTRWEIWRPNYCATFQVILELVSVVSLKCVHTFSYNNFGSFSKFRLKCWFSKLLDI